MSEMFSVDPELVEHLETIRIACQKAQAVADKKMGMEDFLAFSLAWNVLALRYTHYEASQDVIDTISETLMIYAGTFHSDALKGTEAVLETVRKTV